MASQPGNDRRRGLEAARCKSHGAPKGAGGTGQAGPLMGSRPGRVTDCPGWPSPSAGQGGTQGHPEPGAFPHGHPTGSGGDPPVRLGT